MASEAPLIIVLMTLMASSSTAFELPNWQDLFSALTPYRTPEEEDEYLRLEEESPRLGFVQVRPEIIVMQPRKKE